MEVLSSAASQMLMLFVIVALGFLARKIHIMNDDFDSLLSKLVMSITLPGMILNSVLSNTNLPDNDVIWTMLGLSTLLYAVSSALSFAFVRLAYRGVSKRTQSAHMFVIAFGNTGFIGFAVIGALMGPDAVLYGAIYNIPFNLFIFSVGVMFIASTGTEAPNTEQGVVQKVKMIVKQLVSPALISCLVAMALALCHITDTGFFGQTCSLLGQMTVPASMLIIGSTLAKMPLKEMVNDGWSYVTSAMRLLVVPLLAYFGLGLFVTDHYLLTVIAILSAMPAATLGTMLCLAYGGDVKAMARTTFLSTVLSIVTLPIVALIVI